MALNEQVAIHEAGHFIVGDELGLPVKGITFIPNAEENYSARTECPLYNNNGIEITIYQADCNTQHSWLACCYAGIEAQNRKMPNHVQNWHDHKKELQQASELAVHICVNNLGILPDDDLVTQQKLDQEVSELTKRQQKCAYEIVRNRWEEIERLALALFTQQKSLTANEARLAAKQDAT